MLIRDAEPRAATSTFAQLLSSVNKLLALQLSVASALSSAAKLTLWTTADWLLPIACLLRQAHKAQRMFCGCAHYDTRKFGHNVSPRMPRLQKSSRDPKGTSCTQPGSLNHQARRLVKDPGTPKKRKKIPWKGEWTKTGEAESEQEGKVEGFRKWCTPHFMPACSWAFHTRSLASIALQSLTLSVVKEE